MMLVCVWCATKNKKTAQKILHSTHHAINSKSYYEIYHFGKIIRYTSMAKLLLGLLCVRVHVMVMTIVLALPRSSP